MTKASTLLKGKYHANLMSFQNPKMFVCHHKQKIIIIVYCFVPARHRVGRNALKLKKFWPNVFKFSRFCFPKCARRDHGLILSRTELISFLSLFYNYFVAK